MRRRISESVFIPTENPPRRKLNRLFPAVAAAIASLLLNTQSRAITPVSFTGSTYTQNFDALSDTVTTPATTSSLGAKGSQPGPSPIHPLPTAMYYPAGKPQTTPAALPLLRLAQIPAVQQ
jgi:hypothetical protein